MNWIFEVYGDTYNAMLMQSQALPSASATQRATSRPLPVLHAIGYLLGRR